jgi:7-keto-8-aminopelargonate synthetase-like enzyme
MIFCESISSSTGSIIDLHHISSLSQTYNSLLVVDDSLAFGVKGEKGLGLAAKQGDIDLILCSLSNSASTEGAFLACSSWMKNLIRKNDFYRESSMTYSSLGSTEMALELIPSLEGERYQLEQRCHWLKKQLQDYEVFSSTHLACLHFSQEGEMMHFWESLLQRGILAQPLISNQRVSYTLRFFINIHHTPDDLRTLIDEIKELKSN